MKRRHTAGCRELEMSSLNLCEVVAGFCRPKLYIYGGYVKPYRINIIDDFLGEEDVHRMVEYAVALRYPDLNPITHMRDV